MLTILTTNPTYRTMKKEEQMIDALLQEHAGKGAGDDVEFLKDLEQRLDEESSVTEITAGQKPANRGRIPTIGIGIAAALTVVAVGYYGWEQDRQEDLALNDSYHVESPPSVEISERTPPQEEIVSPVLQDKPLGFKGEGKELVKPEKGNRIPSRPSVSQLKASKEEADAVVRPTPLLESPVKRPKSMRGVAAKPELRTKRKSLELSTGGGGAESIIGRQYRRSHDASRPPSLQKAAGNQYSSPVDNSFLSPWKAPLSTFSVDVDTASYANMRRMIQSSQSVPKGAVRIEEMINYFNYSYPQPEGKHPFSVNVETASCPWNTEHRLVKIGLKGKDIVREKRPAANLVFLLDVSGSMNSHDKLPLLVDSMKILLKELNGDDSVSIVVYAGAQGLALPPTHVDEDGRKAILNKLNNFHSGGSTNGGAGIQLAYKMAKKHFVKGGINRVILGTDGDFNVGMTDSSSLVSMVEREAKSGVYLSVLGLGNGNFNDAMLEDITNKGNGNYSYIDSLREGRKVFLDDMMGNLVTIAKDVKIQVEFNPAKVKSYRLIGYANRILKAEDFKNKRIDAGEIGAGHTVTALYEIVPGNAAEAAPTVDDLKYQKSKKQEPPKADRDIVDSPEMLTVKLAYKGPEATKETESTYFETAAIDSEKAWRNASDDFKFSSGVALFGMLQRGSEYSGQGSYQLVRDLAEQGRGEDLKGLRTEFSDLVRKVSK